jgi:hypothetical protein
MTGRCYFIIVNQNRGRVEGVKHLQRANGISDKLVGQAILDVCDDQIVEQRAIGIEVIDSNAPHRRFEQGVICSMPEESVSETPHRIRARIALCSHAIEVRTASAFTHEVAQISGKGLEVCET